MNHLKKRKRKKTNSSLRTLLLIDGSNLAHRAYQKFKNLKAPNGKPTGLIYGFMRLLQSYVVRFGTSYVIVTFDTRESKESNFRVELLKDYKKHRKENKINMDYDDFNRQLRLVKRMLKLLNVPVIWDGVGLGHEADDYIGYLTLTYPGKVIIVSSDKDFCQLLDKRVKIYNPFKDSMIHYQTCSDYMDYTADECVDYLCLLGDKSDDIPGYKGMGPVKIRQFLDEFKSIENFLSNKKNTFKGIDHDGLELLYERNRELIDIKVALSRYPIKKLPLLKQKRKSIYVDKLREIFKKQQLMSFLTDEYMESFKKLKAWEKGLLKSNLLGVVE